MRSGLDLREDLIHVRAQAFECRGVCFRPVQRIDERLDPDSGLLRELFCLLLVGLDPLDASIEHDVHHPMG
jgi:hypothetical protein